MDYLKKGFETVGGPSYPMGMTLNLVEMVDRVWLGRLAGILTLIS